MMNNYVKVSITGRNPRLFVRRYFFNKIKYSNYKEVNHNQIVLKMRYEDYLLISEKSSIYKIKIIKFYGQIKFKKIIENNYTFIISSIICLIFLYIISNVCFKINIIHNNTEIRSLVKAQLQENKIDKFKLIPNFIKRRKIIDKIVKNNKNKLEWLEIEKKGSILIVKVTERKINKEKESTKPRHIIAKKNGIIIKIQAENGVIVKKKNDYVKKGETIVSGDIIKDETVKGQVRAKGMVYAETWYLVKVLYPLKYKETIYLNDVKNNIIFDFFNKSFSLKKNYEQSYLQKKKTFIKSKVFPFKISVQKQIKTKTKNQKYTPKQAILKAEELALKKINTKLNTDEYVISKKTLNFHVNDSKIEVDVFFKVCENITDYKDVDESLLKPKENIN